MAISKNLQATLNDADGNWFQFDSESCFRKRFVCLH